MKRLLWIINRLRVMSVREVLFRASRAALQFVENVRVAGGWQPLPGNPVTARLSLFDGASAQLPGWQQAFRLDERALDETLAGRIRFFGHEPMDVGQPVRWQRDPVTGVEAPFTYGKSLNYRDDRLVGNVKFTWELGRHQHLVPLAVAYAVSGKKVYRDAIAGQLDGWIDSNPFARGVHWCSALEAALRLISWAVVHSLLALRDGEKGLFAAVGDADRLGISIYQQAYFVRHYLSRYSSANNHLIGELTGLFVACTVFDLGQQGEQWLAFAGDELEREAGLQVCSDGVNREQAFYYHLWVLEYLFLAWLAGSHTEQRFSNGFVERILSMTRFLADAAPDGGEPPQVGDADDGFVVRFSPAWPARPYREMLDAVGAVFGKSDVRTGEKAFWYRAMLAPAAMPSQRLDWKRHYPVSYPEGGYAMLGAPDCHLVFDAGPLGYLGIAAHGHADALSFCLALDGVWWLVDPGTYAYHSDPAWRSYFRSTVAHNTICINGLDQSRMSGAFMWLEKARACLEICSETGGTQYVRGSHDGYEQLGVRHVRELRCTAGKGEIEVIDTLQGAQVEKAEIFFHFAPEIRLTPGPAENCWSAVRSGSSRKLLVYTDPGWEYECLYGSTDPILGWYSQALEEKTPSVTLRGMLRNPAQGTSRTRIVTSGG